ncbi:MAG: tetratricopeptide repeat protein, partial [Myxococcales bacterium]|nr:tetratricopeptide repeat protein [Myxococcales bacterium]
AVARGVCRLGLRRFPRDARFSGCLARVAAAEGEHVEATAWYVHAIERAPEVRPLYDEALERMHEFIEAGIRDARGDEVRQVASRAERLLAERTRRWPDSPPPVPAARLLYQMGRIEMNVGNALEAQRYLEASPERSASWDALVALGLLADRTGEAEQAIRLYRRALDLLPPEADEARASTLEWLGLAFARAGRMDQAARMFEQSLHLWTNLAPRLEGPALADLQVHRGLLLDHLGRHEEAVLSFRDAMGAAPRARAIYERILVHLVITTPAPELALEVFLRARRQLTLEPEWKVYFALWVRAVRGRAGLPPNEEIEQILRQHAESPAWWGQLARFGAGLIPYEELLAAASELGQQTEAHFYEATRRLVSGDLAGAQLLFRRVIATNMIRFYEFEMAQELLGDTPDSDSP